MYKPYLKSNELLTWLHRIHGLCTQQQPRKSLLQSSCSTLIFCPGPWGFASIGCRKACVSLYEGLVKTNKLIIKTHQTMDHNFMQSGGGVNCRHMSVGGGFMSHNSYRCHLITMHQSLIISAPL